MSKYSGRNDQILACANKKKFKEGIGFEFQDACIIVPAR